MECIYTINLEYQQDKILNQRLGVVIFTTVLTLGLKSDVNIC